ncbi:MAG: peptide chain release factor N(5)-glutamine methyltransferase [Gammaproteobacteria bacterium]|nr:peptide chain release factor N(5)-glutamine methyltransferase [Gammaproteobacteria bacterium]
MVDAKHNELFGQLEQKIAKQLVTLPDKPEESAFGTVSALWQLASGDPMSVEQALNTTLPELSEAQIEKLNEYIHSRLNGTPLAHITGRQQFMGIDFLAGIEALVPRKETELLGNAALKLVNEILETQDKVRVIDVCTGSGNLALAIAKHVDNTEVYAADLSGEAVSLAQKNSAYLELEERVTFRVGDLIEPFSSNEFYNTVDLLMCNPPYISSGKLETMPEEIIEFEPSMAFDGGPFGIKIVNRLIKEAPEYVREGGWLAFEVGLGQGEPMIKRLGKNKNYTELREIKNDDGDVRAILAKVTHNTN